MDGRQGSGRLARKDITTHSLTLNSLLACPFSTLEQLQLFPAIYLYSGSVNAPNPFAEWNMVKKATLRVKLSTRPLFLIIDDEHQRVTGSTRMPQFSATLNCHCFKTIFIHLLACLPACLPAYLLASSPN